MKEPQIFQEVNKIYEQFEQENQDKEKDNLVQQVLEKFYQQHAQNFTKINTQNFYQNFETYESLNNQLVQIEGTIVDVFEHQVTVKKVLMNNQKQEFLLMSNLADQEQVNINEENIVHTEYQDLQPFLIFLKPDENQNFVTELWNELNQRSQRDLFHQNCIPIVVYSYYQNHDFQLGKKMKFFGYLQKQKQIDNQQTQQQNCFSDYYSNDIVYNLYLFKNTLINSEDFSLTEKDINIVKIFQQNLESIFKDPLAALLLLFTFYTNSKIKLSEIPLNFLNVNLYNCKDFQIDQFKQIMKQLNIDNNWITINKENLEKKIFAVKNYDFDIMELHQLYAGSQDSIFIDERNLQVEKFQPLATKNIMRLQEIVQFQKLSIFFTQNQIFKYPFENQVVSFSEGRSIFPFTIKICLKETENNFEEEFNTENIKQIKDIFKRMCNKINKIDFLENDIQEIQKSFVELRQCDKEFSQDNFALIIKIAKHLAVLQNKDKIDKSLFYECILIFKEMQKREKDYLKKLQQKNENENKN